MTHSLKGSNSVAPQLAATQMSKCDRDTRSWEASTHKHHRTVLCLWNSKSPTYLLSMFRVGWNLKHTQDYKVTTYVCTRQEHKTGSIEPSQTPCDTEQDRSGTVRGEVHCICTTPYPSYQTATSSSWHARQATRQRSMADIQRSNPCTHTPTYGTGVPRAWYTNILGSQLSSLFITPEIHYKNRVKIQISNLGLMIRKLQCVHDSKIQGHTPHHNHIFFLYKKHL